MCSTAIARNEFLQFREQLYTFLVPLMTVIQTVQQAEMVYKKLDSRFASTSCSPHVNVICHFLDELFLQASNADTYRVARQKLCGIYRRNQEASGSPTIHNLLLLSFDGTNNLCWELPPLRTSEMALMSCFFTKGGLPMRRSAFLTEWGTPF